MAGSDREDILDRLLDSDASLEEMDPRGASSEMKDLAELAHTLRLGGRAAAANTARQCSKTIISRTGIFATRSPAMRRSARPK